ncbi:HlyD family secretion protein [Granulicella cerasi]|uniref:HlyD family secretion protein n=1 Tax=Granulicella cerasi TaxID=741063 RepID=A0ABW1ZDQ7_9BACT|nr:HlyD family secretion protein [Granulicella cerasi]
MADNNDQHQQQPEGAQTAQISGTVQIQPQGGNAQQGQPQDGKKDQQPEETPEKSSKRKAIILIVVVLLVLGAGFFYWRSTFTEDTDDAQVDGDLFQVSARVAGQVIHVDVTDQQMVKAGDPIAELDPKDLQVALEQAEASLATAQAQYIQESVNVPITGVNVRTDVQTSNTGVANNVATVQQAQANAEAARSRIAQAKANALKAKIDVDRYTPLVAKDVISKQQFDQAVATATATQAQLDEAERSAAASQQQVTAAEAQLARAQAQDVQSRQNAPQQVKVQQAKANAALASVQQAQAKVDQAKLNLSYAKIVAPIDGIVSKKNVDVGENLGVGQDLLTIVPLRNLWVTANFKETQLAKMQKDQKVDIEVDALGGRHFEGKITQVGGATGSRLSLFPPENATGNYVKVVQRIPVRIDFTNLDKENGDNALRPGMSVVPSVHIK